ncbi:hypothetical protein CLOSTHATH_07474 [Hungatella hathewayi DSM 13479]|uniref:Uncharacterized protein n=1 Tax=Hungatella hathewayi DSM 13479 TaxID=566550 RepID=D3AV04_9FIRM|nr:hypothetical protein CLOSTHATH_07474 [Hungatella hathewayi DSM 13479]
MKNAHNKNIISLQKPAGAESRTQFYNLFFTKQSQSGIIMRFSKRKDCDRRKKI